MKKIIFILTLSICGSMFSQINLVNPANVTSLTSQSNAFIDASSAYDPVKTGENNTGKGLIFPQVDLTSFEFDFTTPGGRTLPTYYDGMVVYNTGKGQTIAEASKGGARVMVDKGFYYFFNPDGRANKNVETGKWVKIADPKGFWSLAGNAGTTPVQLQNKNGGDYTIKNIDDANFIGTTDAKSVTMATNNVARLEIGELGHQVGTKNFEFVLDVYGKARFRKGIVTATSTYPDYVFDNYFTGESEENPNYEFKKLNEVEKFIKENNHLPGVTSIKELTKSDNGYNVDNTQLSIQTLEKVEELYLHVIEQQKEIQALKAEIAELKK